MSMSAILAILCCERRLRKKEKTKNAAKTVSSVWASEHKDFPKVSTISRRNCVGNDRRSCESTSEFNKEKQAKQFDRRQLRICICINKEITSRSRAGPEPLQQYISELCAKKQTLNDVNVATIFHSSAKHPSILTAEVLNYLMDAAEKIEMDARALANTLYGLQGLKNSAAVNRVLRVMTAKVQRCDQEFSSRQLANAFYGFNSLKDCMEVHGLLRALAPKMKSCTQDFTVQGIASTCFGLRSLGDRDEVRSIIQALAVKTERLNEILHTQEALAKDPGNLQNALHPHMAKEDYALDGWAIGNALYGMQNLGDSPEVRRMINVIAVQLEKLDKPMKAQEVTIAFYGLRSFRGSPPEICRLLAALALQLKACSESFLPRHIASSLYGLRWLQETDEGKSVLAAMAEKTRQCSQPFDGQAVGNALYGLQCYGSSKELRNLLDALTPKVEQCRHVLSAQEVGNSLYGLRAISDCTEVRRMLVALVPKIEQCAEMDPQAISNALYGLHALGTLPQTADILRVLTSKIRLCNESFSSIAISNSFSGIQTMEASPITRDLIAALTSKLVRLKELKADHICNILINFRTVGDSEQVREILKFLEPKLNQCSDILYPQHIATSFVGLSHLGDSAEVIGMLRAFIPHVRRCENFSPHQIASCLCCFKSKHDSQVIRPLLKVFAPKLDQCNAALKASGPKFDDCSDAATETYLKRACHSVRGLGDCIEAQAILQKLTELASHWAKVDQRRSESGCISNGLR